MKIIICLLFSIAAFGSERLILPEVPIPRITIGKALVRMLLVSRTCQRQVKAFERIGNGFAQWKNCDNLSIEPMDNSENGLIVEAGLDGHFVIPRQLVSFERRPGRDDVVCVRLEPIARVNNYGGHIYVQTAITKEKLVYCNRPQIPSWAESQLKDTSNLLIRDYVSTLSEGLDFSFRN